MSGEESLDVLIETSLANPIAVALAKSLLQEAGIPFVAIDPNSPFRQEGGNPIFSWNVRVPREREAEAREILQSVEETR
jgi:hypothetical protein